jgi:transcriptional regulator with GAF, ATPase, and Fis domain
METLTQTQNDSRRAAMPLLDKDKLLESIFRISTVLTAPSNLDEVLSKILDEVVDTIGFDRGLISLFDETKRYLETKVVKNFSEEAAKKAFAVALDIHKHDSIAAKVTKTGQLIAIEDTATDPRVNETDRILANIYKRGAIFCAPLKIGDEVIGILVAWRKEATKFFPEEINLLLTFASQISIIIYNTRLFEEGAGKIRKLTILQEAVSEMNFIGIQSDRIADILITNAVKITGANKALLYLRDVENEQCLIHDNNNFFRGEMNLYRNKIKQSIIKESMDTNIVLKKQAPSNIPSATPIFNGYTSEIALPLCIKEKAIGALYLAKESGGYSKGQANVLDILVKNAATSYDNAMMHALLSQEANSLKTEVNKLKEREDILLGFHNILGKSENMLKIFRTIEEVAGHNTNVLIQGASGTGKELFSRAIHKQSDRSSKPFVDVNCAALPETLLESELFGHEAGAFTDAKKRKIGLLEYAKGGTVLLDEIGEMSMHLQAKFLRVLEDGHVRRLGGNENIPIDVRFIFSTNKDINRMVAEGTFRSDLYYRISVVPIIVPPLSARSEDIIILAEYFVGEFNKKFGKKVEGFTKEAAQILQIYPWPGNVRELKNIIERIMITPDLGTIITPENLPADVKKQDIEKLKKKINKVILDSFLPNLPVDSLDFETLTQKITREVKAKVITKALELSSGNKTNAAKLLGISRFKFLREQKRTTSP